MASAYWGELRTHWRALMAAAMESGFGLLMKEALA